MFNTLFIETMFLGIRKMYARMFGVVYYEAPEDESTTHNFLFLHFRSYGCNVLDCTGKIFTFPKEYGAHFEWGMYKGNEAFSNILAIYSSTKLLVRLTWQTNSSTRLIWRVGEHFNGLELKKFDPND